MTLTLPLVAQKGISANLLKPGSKRRKRKNDTLEDMVVQSQREQISQEVER